MTTANRALICDTILATAKGRLFPPSPATRSWRLLNFSMRRASPFLEVEFEAVNEIEIARTSVTFGLRARSYDPVHAT